MTKKILTISIPTWNRAKLVKDLLDSLIVQILQDNLSDEIEIVVSNNGSEDNTHEVVEELRSKYSFITYNRNAYNIGGNPNVMKSMQMANAVFFMVLGDDDRITEGSLKRIVDYLKSKPEAGIVIDSQYFKTKFLEGEIPLNDLLRNEYWRMGNAGMFVMRSVFAKDCLSKFGNDFFNDCWSQIQFMILGLHGVGITNPDLRLKVYTKDLDIISHSIHGEVTIYTSFYLWNTTYYQLFRTIKTLENIVDKETSDAAKGYLKGSLIQVVFNILQCGVFIDSKEERQKTIAHIRKNLHQFSSYEKRFLRIILFELMLLSSLARLLSNVFIFLLKGKTGIIKKNYFVRAERNKREKAKKAKSIDVRILEFSNEN